MALAVAVPPPLAAGYTVLAVLLVPLAYLLLRRERSFADLLCIAGLAVLAFCEIFYFEEMLGGGDYSRFNTVFKFYFDAWILLGTGTLLLAGGWLAGRRSILPETARKGVAVAAAVALVAAPPVALNIDIGRGGLLGIDYPPLRATTPWTALPTSRPRGRGGRLRRSITSGRSTAIT